MKQITAMSREDYSMMDDDFIDSHPIIDLSVFFWDCTEMCDFSPYHAEKILRFCRENETAIVLYETEKELAEKIAQAVENVYGLAQNQPPYEDLVFRFIRLKSYEMRYSQSNDLSPMDYCKMIIKLTAEQVAELKNGTCEAGYRCSDFFWNRQCDIVLKSGTRIKWHLELGLDEIIIPDPDEIEYVKFSHCVPMIAASGDYPDKYAYSADCIYGLCDKFGGEMEFDSVYGIIKPAELPEKYRSYTQLN